jgi:hypothetical protein
VKLLQNCLYVKLTEACRRLTNGNTALAHWIGSGSSRLAKSKVLAPLLAAGAMDDQFDTGGSQRRVA